MSWRKDYWQSIKSFDTEEKIDLYFYRPLGFLIAKIAIQLRASPTTLTTLGLLCGISSGYFFYFNESLTSLSIGTGLFILAGVFDSSDGQLARMGGKSTELGLVLDGLCDNLVFGAAYLGSALTIFPQWGHWTWPLLAAAAVCHSFQSACLDFYNREYLYFGYGKIKGGYWNPTLDEATGEMLKAKGIHRILWTFRRAWIWQQNQLSGRKKRTRMLWKKFLIGPRSQKFQDLYRKENRLILRFWRVLGPNFHTILLLTAIFFKRFDIYLLCIDIIFLTLALFAIRFSQKQIDHGFSQTLRQNKLRIRI